MVRLDAGLATTLQSVGLPANTPVEPWLATHPDRIVRAYRAFHAAGSQVALTATFMALALPLDLSATVRRAVQCVRDAGLQPWGCTGPVFERAEDVLPLATALADNDVHSLVLETFTSGDAAIDALRALRRHSDLDHIVLSVVPTDTGTHTRDNLPLSDWARRAMDAGATGIGVNCVSPTIAAVAVRQLATVGPVWVKPSGAPDWADTVRTFEGSCAWLGGCCGVHPADLEALWQTA